MNTYFYQKVITLQNESYYGIRKENLTTRYTGHRGSVLSLDKNSNIHNTISVFKFIRCAVVAYWNSILLNSGMVVTIIPQAS